MGFKLKNLLPKGLQGTFGERSKSLLFPMGVTPPLETPGKTKSRMTGDSKKDWKMWTQKMGPFGALMAPQGQYMISKAASDKKKELEQKANAANILAEQEAMSNATANASAQLDARKKSRQNALGWMGRRRTLLTGAGGLGGKSISGVSKTILGQ